MLRPDAASCSGSPRRLGALAVVLWFAATAAFADQQRFSLVERLGQDWQRQLVRFPFEAAKGTCHRESLRLTEKGRPVAFQLLDVEAWPGEPEMIRSADVALVVDLRSLQARSFLVQFDPKPVERSVVATDLAIAREADSVRMTTSRFGVHLPLGERKFDPPANADSVPEPALAMRLAKGGATDIDGDGLWFGGSRLYGDTKVRRFEARLTEAGPILGEVALRYEYADGNTLELKAQLSAGDSAVYWDMDVKNDRPDSGWQLALNRGLPPLTFPVQAEARTSRGIPQWSWAHVRLDKHPPGLITNLTPWGDWFDDYSQTAIRLQIEGTKTELRLVSRDPGAWVKPAPMGVWLSSGGRKQKLMPLRKSADGEVALDVNLAAGTARRAQADADLPVGGVRRWYVGQFPAVSPVPDPSTGLTKNREVWERRAQVQFSSRRLDAVKDLVLDWPERPERQRPRMFVTPTDLERARRDGSMPDEVREGAERLRGRPIDRNPAREVPQALAAWWLSGDRKVAEELRLAERLREHLGLLGDFDLMRSAAIVAMLYDALIDTDLVMDEQRPLLRARMAYLAYRAADPSTWSMERGYTSGNPNMSVSYVLGLGTVACALPDHPMARQWAAPAIHRMDNWLENELGPKGEWMEGAHYDHVSGFTMLAFVIAAKNAGLHDFSVDPRFKRLMLYIGKHYTPPDPTRGGYRVHAPLGRRHAGSRTALPGLVARLTADSDPAYSRVMQWLWKSMGRSAVVYDRRLAGAEYLCLDPSLSAEIPDWQSELFPRVGALLRYGVGTRHEHCLGTVLNGNVLFARPSEMGAVTRWFAMGRPIGGLFTGGEDDRHELLSNRVMLARSVDMPESWRPTGYEGHSRVESFAALPRQDYFDARFTIEKPWVVAEWKMPEDVPRWPEVSEVGRPPVAWRRQALYLKAHDPSRPGYLVLRDTVSGNQPTMWQFWTLSQKVGTPEQVAELDAFLADKPGVKPSPARELKGNRFTAVGQFDVDLEYFIAAPDDTPRHTLRWGNTSPWPVRDYSEYQDLLNLRLPDDGHYLVVLYPRWRNDPAPEFSEHADGNVVKIASRDGTDYVLLADEKTLAAVDGVRFDASVASVRRGKQGMLLCLGGPGEAACGDLGLAADGPASLAYESADEAFVCLPRQHDGTRLRLALPPGYRVDRAGMAPGHLANLGERSDPQGRLLVDVPAGVDRVPLLRPKN